MADEYQTKLAQLLRAFKSNLVMTSGNDTTSFHSMTLNDSQYQKLEDKIAGDKTPDRSHNDKLAHALGLQDGEAGFLEKSTGTVYNHGQIWISSKVAASSYASLAATFNEVTALTPKEAALKEALNSSFHKDDIKFTYEDKAADTKYFYTYALDLSGNRFAALEKNAGSDNASLANALGLKEGQAGYLYNGAGPNKNKPSGAIWISADIDPAQVIHIEQQFKALTEDRATVEDKSKLAVLNSPFKKDAGGLTFSTGAGHTDSFWSSELNEDLATHLNNVITNTPGSDSRNDKLAKVLGLKENQAGFLDDGNIWISSKVDNTALAAVHRNLAKIVPSAKGIALEKALNEAFNSEFTDKFEFVENGSKPYFSHSLNHDQLAKLGQVNDDELATKLGLAKGKCGFMRDDNNANSGIWIEADVDPKKAADIEKRLEAITSETTPETAKNLAALNSSFKKDGAVFTTSSSHPDSFWSPQPEEYEITVLQNAVDKDPTPGDRNAKLAHALGLGDKQAGFLEGGRIWISTSATPEALALVHDKFVALAGKPDFVTKSTTAIAPANGQQSDHHFIFYTKDGGLQDSRGEVDTAKKGDVGVGARGAPVRDIQTMLKYLNHDANLGATGYNTKDGIDNDYGKLTAAAVKKYQAGQEGLTATGRADEHTRESLLADFLQKWNAEHKDKSIDANASINDKAVQDVLHQARVEFSKGTKDPKLVADNSSPLGELGQERAYQQAKGVFEGTGLGGLSPTSVHQRDVSSIRSGTGIKEPVVGAKLPS